MNSLTRTLAILAAVLLVVGPGNAQWPDDPATNLVISSGAGEQTTPIVESTSDGGCYVLFYNNGSGNYDTYLQKLDPDGNVMWENGLLVSGNEQNSSVTEWDFAVDMNDNAIVCVNDLRDGTDWDVYGYSIAPDGTFNWGANGVTLSDTDATDLAQQIMVASNGDVVFGWQSDGVINLRRINQAGQDVWDPAIIEISSTYSVSIPRFAPTSDGGFLLQYLVAQGSQFWSPKHLYLNRFDTAGQPQWSLDGIAINDAGGFGVQMRPDLVNDGNDGAISFWYSDHVSLQLHAFVQHTTHDGTPQWTANGLQVSTAAELQFMPAVAYDEANGYIYFFYETANTGQTANGMGAQMVDMDGNRQWTDAGVTLIPLSTQQQYHLYAGLLPDGTGAVVNFCEYQDGVNAYVKSFGLDATGASLWQTSPMVLSSVLSSKGHHYASMTTNGQMVSVWNDKRSDSSGDLYIQNVNPDGTLGAYAGNDPIYVELLNPNPVVIPAGGAVISYDVHVFNSTATTYPNIRYFTHVLTPNGNTYGPLSNIVFTLTAGMDVTVPGMQQNIPAFAPAGTYTFIGSIGYLSGPSLSDSFDFEKSAVASDGIDNWNASNSFAIASDVADGQLAAERPERFELSQVYPNPFNPTATITVALPQAAELTVAVYNALGQQVVELANGYMSAGVHNFTLDGSSLASGLYFVNATIPGELNAVQKVVLMK